MALTTAVPAPMAASGQQAPGVAVMDQAAPASRTAITTDKAAAAWAIGAIALLAVMRRYFRGSVI